jgi:5'-methylthioadenosine phosphorylase
MRSKLSKIGIIGGSGIEDLDFAKNFKTRIVKTPFGKVPIREGKVSGKEVVFLVRHGRAYLLPSEINYRANITALKKMGVGKIITSAAVGAINRKMHPGDFATLSDFIDFTRGKRETFTSHSFIDMSSPYDAGLNALILKAAKKLELKIRRDVVYACSEGPRFETRAEIRAMARLGADVVGMTQVPEVVLAAEAGIPYAAIVVVTNYAAGVTPRRIEAGHVVAMMKGKSKILSQMIFHVIESIS